MDIKTRVELLNIEETFTRPMLVSITNDIKEMVSLDKNTYTIYDMKDNLIQVKNKDGELEGFNTLTNEMVVVSYEENMTENDELTQNSLFNNDLSLFVDKDIGISIRPIYHHRKYNLQFIYKTKFKNRMVSLVNRLKMLPANSGWYTNHDIEYGYLIPTYVSKWLKTMYTLKTRREQDHEELEDFIKNGFDDRLDLLNRADGRPGSRLVIREAQIGLVGYLNSDLYNIRSDYDESTKEWTIELEYEFYVEKPVSLILEYPIIIYNRLVPKEYRDFINYKKESPRAYHIARHDNTDNLNYPPLYTSTGNNYHPTIPEEDRVQFPDTGYYGRILSVLVTVEDEDPRKLFNIKDLGKIRFKQTIIDYILEEEWDIIHDTSNSLFRIELFEGNDVKFDMIRMDKEGNIYSKEDLDYKKVYRVVFSINKYLNSLDYKAYNRLTRYVIKDFDKMALDHSNKDEIFFYIYLNLLDIRLDIMDKNNPFKYLRDDIYIPTSNRLYADMKVENLYTGNVFRNKRC